jgi:hypothetical protein
VAASTTREITRRTTEAITTTPVVGAPRREYAEMFVPC